jgi:hypothetical protein
MTKEEKREYDRKRYESRKEKIKSDSKKYYDEHRDTILEKRGKYYLEHKSEIQEYQNEYRIANKDRLKEYRLQNKEERKTSQDAWLLEHPGYMAANSQKYRSTKPGRAAAIIHRYAQNDIYHNRGKCTLTREWVVDHIFSSSCAYCGDSDWTHLGCDRIDNSLPHTPENCVCACGICNMERQIQEMSIEEFKKYRSENPRKCDIKKVG